MATYAIGDIQGCFDMLQQLLAQVEFDPNQDELWVAGDMVNRGPQSLQTLRYLKGLGAQATLVLGNHDLHLLAIAEGIKRPHRSDSIMDVLRAPDRDELLYWLRQQPLLYYNEARNYLLVHAGLAPQWSIAQALALAQEVEQVLRGDDYHEFLVQMYGDLPDCWDDNLSGWPRMRLITNYLTRMRLCSPEGLLDLKHHEGIENAPQGMSPWFAHPQRKTRSINILFGHWAALEGESNEDHVYALDTGCVWGRRLTTMRLEDHAVFSCDCQSLRRTPGGEG